jgi:hypothetical protein
MEFGIHMKLVMLIKMCLIETYSKVHIGKHLSDNFHIQNYLKQGDVLPPLLFNLTLEYDIRKVGKKPCGTELKGSHQILAYSDDVNLLGEKGKERNFN